MFSQNNIIGSIDMGNAASEQTKNWVDSRTTSKDQASFQSGIRLLPEKWEKAIAN